MRRHRILYAALCASVVASPLPAAAQSYYARTIVAPSTSQNQSPPPSTPGSWTTGPWSSSSSTCSTSATQTRSVTCTVGGSVVPDANCSAAKPESSQTVTDLSSCTYTPTYSTTYGACVGGYQTAPIVSCKRSDGATVANADCGAANQNSPPQACTVAPQCSSFVYNATVAGQSSYQIKNIAVMSVSSALSAAASYCTSVKADACQLDNANNFVIAYFGTSTKITCNATSCSNNGRYAASCTH